jgi:hypothetical protein
MPEAAQVLAAGFPRTNVHESWVSVRTLVFVMTNIPPAWRIDNPDTCVVHWKHLLNENLKRDAKILPPDILHDSLVASCES